MNKRYRKKKKRLTFPMLLLVVLGMMVLFYVCELPEDKKVVGYITHVVREGDTIWGIAEKHCSNDMDIRKMVRAIKDVNDVNTDIYDGDQLLVPVYSE